MGMEAGSLKLEAGSWKVRGWKLEVGRLMLEAESSCFSIFYNE